MADIELISEGMDELLKSDEVATMLTERMQGVLSDAQAATRSTEVRSTLEQWTVMHPTRVVARVGSDAPSALAVESRSGTLARALDAAG